MAKRMIVCGAVLVTFLGTVSAQYQDWLHSGRFYILTTPEGADLPATALEENFPLLVRLNQATFDFSQAQSDGADIRFSGEGKPLAYQIEQWDAADSRASIWVRIGVIKGNASQEIKMHWGKADAAAESNGAAVFNESNGFLSVMHLTDPVKDEVGTLAPTDTGTTASAGMIGLARHFDKGKGINCGETITTLPSGASDHSSEAWFRAEASNALALAWGNEHGQGKVTMRVASPAHVKMECYFSGADVSGASTLAMGQWVQVVHTYCQGDSRVYVNGRLDGVSSNPASPLAIKSPARMYVGGWYNDYRFVGDIDEVRISKVVRSADWVRLQYENQKCLQTLVGALVPPGNDFSVSRAAINVDEGKSVTVTAKAGDAHKVYWVLTREGVPTVVAVDQYAYTLDAGRVVTDTSYVLQFKAVYAHEVRTRDIPVTVKETIPEPVFTLKAPSKWNGRKRIEVVPAISNLAAMTAKEAGALHYTWTVSGGAVIKEVASDRLILKRSQYTGPITVTAAINNGGADTVAAKSIKVNEPKRNLWIQRTPGKDETPEDNQFFARDDKNEGTLFYNGTLDHAADSVFLKVYADDKLINTQSRRLKADKAYAFTVKLKAGLIKYRVVFGSKRGHVETVIRAVSNLVCGDAYMIQGQSNAVAYNYYNVTDRSDFFDTTSDWIRFYSSLSVMSTLAFSSGQNCHFDLADYEKIGLAMFPLVERDNYAKIFDKPITAPDLLKAYYASDKQEEIVLEFDQPMVWDDALVSQFHLDGKADQIVSGAVSGNVVMLTSASATAATAITYVADKKWDSKNLLYGQNGIAALTFCEVPIAGAKDGIE